MVKIKKLNKKASYDFIDIVIFLLFGIVIFSVLILSISIEQPTVYPKLDADNFITMILYSKNSIFDYNENIEKVDFGKLNLNKLNLLDSFFYVGSSNDKISAKFEIYDEKITIVSEEYYYNKKNYDFWTNTNQVTIKQFDYSIPIRYYKDNSSKITFGSMKIHVLVNVQRPFEIAE